MLVHYNNSIKQSLTKAQHVSIDICTIILQYDGYPKGKSAQIVVNLTT